MPNKLKSITISDDARLILKILTDKGFEGYVVGGCVRDSLMNAVPHDWDICTNALPEQIIEVFSGFKTIPTGIKHGTVTVLVNHQPFEVTTYRTDGEYTDHRRPDSVTFVRNVREDLNRRDFTINAMCADESGRVYDPFDGMGDIERGIIRCVGDPKKRFDEDALRIFRAVRFAAKTGFDIEIQTLRAAIDMKSTLDHVSAERIFSELKSLLVQPYATDVLLKYREIIAQVIPEAAECFDFEQKNPHHCYSVWEHIARSVSFCPNDEALRLVMLFHDIAKPQMCRYDENGVAHFKGHPEKSAEIANSVLLRLKSDNETRKKVTALIAEHDNRISASKKSVRRFISKHGYEFYENYLIVRRADTLAQSMYRREKKLEELERLKQIGEELRAENACLRVSQLAVNGRDLMALGLSGRQIGDMLNRLLKSVVEEDIPNEKDILLSQAQSIISGKA